MYSRLIPRTLWQSEGGECSPLRGTRKEWNQDRARCNGRSCFQCVFTLRLARANEDFGLQGYLAYAGA